MDRHSQVLGLCIPKNQSLHFVHHTAVAPYFDNQWESAGIALARCLLTENPKGLFFCCGAVRTVILKGGQRCYPKTRGSFLILSFTPWSPNERERKVDSDIPGKARGVKTAECQVGDSALLKEGTDL